MCAQASVLHRVALATIGLGETSSSPVSMMAPEQQQQQTAPVITVNSDMVIILASLLSALVLALGIALVTHCACKRRRSANSPPPSKGLKKKAIDALPIVCFAAVAPPQSSSSSSECAICLAEFMEGEGLRVLPQCGHCFHVACVDAWLRTCATCPSCRAPIVATPTVVVVVAANNRCKRCGEVAAPNGGLEDMSLPPFSSFSAFQLASLSI